MRWVLLFFSLTDIKTEIDRLLAMIQQVITETEFESRLHIHAFYPLNYTTFLNGLYPTIKRQRFIHSVIKNSHHRVLSSLNLQF